MANTSTNVTAGKPAIGGAISRALISDNPTIPTSTSTTLSGFDSLGYVSEDGVTNSNSPESENIKAWGGDTVLNTQTDKADTYQIKLIEALNEDVLKAVYTSGNVTTDESTGEIKITANSSEMEEAVWVIDMILREGKKKRIVIPDGKIASVGDIVYKDDEPVGYELTISAMPDASGNTHYEYIL